MLRDAGFGPVRRLSFHSYGDPDRLGVRFEDAKGVRWNAEVCGSNRQPRTHFRVGLNG